MCDAHVEAYTTSGSPSDDVHNKVEVLTVRVRELEHALATLQATYSTAPHPLLRKELRDIAAAPSPPAPPLKPEPEDTGNLSERLGTLSMSGYGKSRFLGTTGGTAVSFSSLFGVSDLYLPF